MEKRLNKKTEMYVTTFKDNIREKAKQMAILSQPEVNNLIQYIYDYDRLSFTKEDFQKRKRVKNIVPIFDRCCAKKSSNEQCTRRKKDESEYCGTHMKGTPHGIIDTQNEVKISTQKIAADKLSTNKTYFKNNVADSKKVHIYHIEREHGLFKPKISIN